MKAHIDRRGMLRGLVLGPSAFVLMAWIEQERPDLGAPLHIQNNDPYWGILNSAPVSIDEKRGLMVASFNDRIVAMNGARISIGGFLLPLDAEQSFDHFVLTRRNSTCAFCPPNEPTEAIEVFAGQTMEFSADEFTVTGIFEAVGEATDGLFYRLRDATVEKLA